MKPLFILLTFILLLSGCTKKDDISGLNKWPVIYIRASNGNYEYFGDPNRVTGKNIADTSKCFPGHGVKYVVKFYDEDLPNHSFEPLLLIRDINLNFDTVPVFGTSPESNVHYIFEDSVLHIGCHTPGSYIFSLEVTDSYGLKMDASIPVTILDNVMPTPVFTVWNSKELDPYEITIDASASRDWQEKWLGAIVMYQYYIDGTILTTTERSVIKHIVPSSGNYKIDVMVKDNEDYWSIFHTGYSSKYVTVTDGK